MELLLRRNDPAQRMPPRQYDPAMINLNTGSVHAPRLRRNPPLHNCPSTRRAPITLYFLAHHRMALAANPLHMSQDYRTLVVRAFCSLIP
jgi:hypothetical protein